MHPPRAGARRLPWLALATAICLVLTACGGSGGSGDAATLLQQTFGESHSVSSGSVSLNVSIDRTGSDTPTGPISFSLDGPFQSRGPGNLPASNFQISLAARGGSRSLRLLSTGTQGYITLEGASYLLPSATFAQLESSFARVTPSPSGGSGSSALTTVGINPLHWLLHPSVVGSGRIAGAEATHIRAGVDVRALLADLNTFLQKASGASAGGEIPHGISAANRKMIAAEVASAGVDVWTGEHDKILRRLAVRLTTMARSGEAPTALRSTAIGVVLQYADLDQPQTITPPTAVQPFAHLSATLDPILQQFETALAGGGSAEPRT